MPFSWGEYLRLAEELGQRTDDQASLRSAISRAYYAVFCTARDFLEREGIPLPSVSLHVAVWQDFQNDPRRQWVNIGRLGERLRYARTRADYEGNFPRLPVVTALSIATARVVLHQLQTL